MGPKAPRTRSETEDSGEQVPGGRKARGGFGGGWELDVRGQELRSKIMLETGVVRKVPELYFRSPGLEHLTFVMSYLR